MPGGPCLILELVLISDMKCLLGEYDPCHLGVCIHVAGLFGFPVVTMTPAVEVHSPVHSTLMQNHPHTLFSLS